MDSKLQDFQLSPSMRSNPAESSAPKKMKSLTLFEDLLENSNPGANLETHREKDSSVCDNHNEAYTTNERSKSWLSLGFHRISDDDIVYQSIKKDLLSSLNSGGYNVQIETIYRNANSTTMGRAKFQSFGLYLTAMREKYGGNANVECAWYGAHKDEVNEIFSYGFNLPMNNGAYGYGFHFSAAAHPLESLQSSTTDAEGLRHMLLCPAIFGENGKLLLLAMDNINPVQKNLT